MHVIRRRSAFLSQMQYRFVDCRWSLDDPGAGRRAYLEGHIPGATFLDVEQDLSSAPGRGGRHPLPSRDGFAAAAGRAGIGPGTFVVAYGTAGRGRAAVVAAAPFRPRRLRRARARGLARTAPGRRGDRRAGGVHAGRADRRHGRTQRARAAARRVGRRRRARPAPLAGRGERRRPCAGPHPGLRQRRRGTTKTRRCPRGSWSRTAAPASRRASPCIAFTSRAAPAASTRARGRSGSRIRRCRSSARRRWRPKPRSRSRSRSRTGRGTAPSAAGSSASPGG